ncbi:MAG: MFS transporter [Clostridia bacterium]|nr:MFS transporter [Clostridia bacterium]
MEINIKNLKQTAVSGLAKLKLYWKEPPEGRYMPFKEIAAVSVGGMGVRFIVTVVSYMILGVGNVLIGNTIGIPPMSLYFIYVISVLAGFPLTTLRARIIDYSHNKKGKYRPYILSMSIPTAILGIGFVFMPYTKMTLFWKCFTVLAFNIGFQFFYNFLNDANDSLINVLSPNTYERSDVFSIKSITDSLAPSIMNIIVPLVAKLVTGEETIYDMRVYRALYPPLLVVGSLMSIIVYANTKEKIVQSKTHVVQMSFMDTMRAVAKNKYFWIISLASCLGFLEGSFGNILGWMYNYQNVCNAGQYALITTIYGNASLWAMIFAPILIRKIGKKNLLVFSNILNIAFIAIMYPVVKSAPTGSMVWMFLICLFINGVVSQVTVTITPSINGDIRDYQQYISGDRVDGIFSVAGLIGSIWTLATGSILPAIYDKAGLNSEVAQSLGYNKNNIYDVLYDEKYFRSICGVLIVASVIGATLNVIPYFFYDLSETKQKGMIAVLKVRAMFEDYRSGNLKDKDLIETVEIIKTAFELENKEIFAPYKKKIKAEKGKAYKKELKELKKLYENKIVSDYVLEEIRYFGSDESKLEVERAEKIIAGGIKAVGKLKTADLAAAKALPKNTKAEKDFRSRQIEIAHIEESSKKAIKKNYPDGLEEFDETVFEKLFAAEDNNEKELKAAYAENDKARTARLRQQKKEIAAEIKKATNYFSIYNRAVKPYTDAERLLQRRENYEKLDEIFALYENAKAVTAE